MVKEMSQDVFFAFVVFFAMQKNGIGTQRGRYKDDRKAEGNLENTV
jgi:hypothetical protein